MTDRQRSIRRRFWLRRWSRTCPPHIPLFTRRSRLMKIRYPGVFAMLLFSLSMPAQVRTAPPSAGVATARTRATFVYRGELGKWWQNSEVARKLQLSDGQIEAQVDQVLGARGKLEREFTMMNLDLRKVLSLDQWRQLKSIQGQGGSPGGDRIFFRKVLPPG